MATSVWLMGICLGMFLGSAGGSATFDLLGFSWSCTIQAAVMAASVRGDVKNSDRFGSFINYFFFKNCLYLRPLLCQHCGLLLAELKRSTNKSVCTLGSLARMNCSSTCRGLVAVNWEKTQLLMNTLYNPQNLRPPPPGPPRKVYLKCFL